MMEYITPEQVANLEGISIRHVLRKVSREVYQSKKFESKKQKGKSITKIRVSSLPTQVQAKLITDSGTGPLVSTLKRALSPPRPCGLVSVFETRASSDH